MSPTTVILKTEIARSLERLGEAGLGEIRAHVAALLDAAGQPRSTRTSLTGIWKDQGFEDVSDLEREIQEARKDLGSAIARRHL